MSLPVSLKLRKSTAVKLDSLAKASRGFETRSLIVFLQFTTTPLTFFVFVLYLFEREINKYLT